MTDPIRTAEATLALLPVLVGKDDAPRIYVEGLSQLNLGYPLSRLVLHHTVEPSTSPHDVPERRHIACELVMPTMALIDMVQVTLSSIAQARDQLPRFHDQIGENLKAMLADVEAARKGETTPSGRS